MWIKKTEAEIKKEELKSRFNPFPPLIFSIIPLIFEGLAIIDLTFRESVFVIVIFYIISYLSQILFLLPEGILLLLYGPLSSKDYICNKCLKIVKYTKSLNCECSGKLEDIKYWKYIDD